MDVTDRRGEIRRILISASPLILGGQIFGGVVVWQEITGQVRTIRTLDEERALLRVIIESIPEAIVVADRDARIRMTNPAADRIYSRAVHPGMDAEHFAALHLCHPGLDPCPPDDLPLVRSARHGEIIQGREFAILGAEGELRDLVADSAPIIGSDGQRIGAAGVFQDLTGRREAERALRESEERFRGIFERAGISIVLADTAGRILRVNPAFQKMLGYSADELQQMTILDLTHPEDAAAALAHFQGTLAGRHETDLMQKRYIAKDGRTVWGQLTTSLLRGPDGEIRFLIGMIEDITDRKRDEELRRQAFDQIERNMEQFAILGDHIRHPLQAILARADLMEDEGTAEKIREQVRRIDALVKRLEEGWIESREIREFLRRNELA
ncbi:MAG: PAS domain S-box protein [Methanomicrobiaceae archaeon]|nr:PAS domain S-box protein [Methanomicrobiaceae archaeon]